MIIKIIIDIKSNLVVFKNKLWLQKKAKDECIPYFRTAGVIIIINVTLTAKYFIFISILKKFLRFISSPTRKFSAGASV